LIRSRCNERGFDTVLIRFRAENEFRNGWWDEKWFRIKRASNVGA
jgi:hypothetical protein